jgi:hypothetical protein
MGSKAGDQPLPIISARFKADQVARALSSGDKQGWFSRQVPGRCPARLAISKAWSPPPWRSLRPSKAAGLRSAAEGAAGAAVGVHAVQQPGVARWWGGGAAAATAALWARPSPAHHSSRAQQQGAAAGHSSRAQQQGSRVCFTTFARWCSGTQDSMQRSRAQSHLATTTASSRSR